MNVQSVKDGLRLIREGMDKLGGGPASWYVDQLVAAYELLMQRYAPFKVGDLVRLSRTIEGIDQEHGWYACRHFLTVGSRGIVTIAECGTKGFSFGVEFFDETWIDQDGIKRIPSRRHTFMFGENDLMVGKFE